MKARVGTGPVLQLPGRTEVRRASPGVVGGTANKNRDANGRKKAGNRTVCQTFFRARNTMYMSFFIYRLAWSAFYVPQP